MTTVKEPTHSDAISHACDMGDLVLQLFIDYGLVEENDLFLRTERGRVCGQDPGKYLDVGELDENGELIEEDVSGFTKIGRSIFEEVYGAIMSWHDENED